MRRDPTSAWNYMNNSNIRDSNIRPRPTVAVLSQWQWKVNAQRLTCCLQTQAQSRRHVLKKGLKILSNQIKLYFYLLIFYF